MPQACNASVGSVEDLLRSRTVVDALQRRRAGNDGETANLVVESACANQAELHGQPSGPADTAWDQLDDDEKSAVIEILARLIAKMMVGKNNQE